MPPAVVKKCDESAILALREKVQCKSSPCKFLSCISPMSDDAKCSGPGLCLMQRSLKLLFDSLDRV